VQKLQGASQRLQRGLGGLEQALSLFRHGQAARGAMQQAHTRVLLELRQRLARGLRRDTLDGCSARDAAHLHGLGESLTRGSRTTRSAASMVRL
jgi:hypothetical protein